MMGTLRGDNGGGERPQEGGGLPDLPPEWGTVIIPDDASELDDEGASVRRVFRREALRRRWRRRLHLKPKPLIRADEDSPGLAVPLLIMSVAVIATLTSLFAVAWPGQRTPRSTPQAASSPAAISVAEIGMVDASGARVRLGEVAPAVILLVEGCTCETFISATVRAVDASRPSPSTISTTSPAVSVLVIDTGVPAVPAAPTPGVTVRGLADPNHALRAAVPVLAVPPGTDVASAALLVDRAGRVLRAVPGVKSAADFESDLKRLW